MALPIYHFPDHMEAPTEMEFADPAHVHDVRRPGEVLDEQMRDAALRSGGLSAANFTVDYEHVFPKIVAMFRRVIHAPAE
jgi:hypothetical protein